MKGRALADRIAKVAPRDRDAFVNDLLGAHEPRESKLTSDDPELVGCLPSGVSAIADAILKARIGPDDVFVDVGSGTGRVAILVHLLTGAGTIGVELDGDLVELSRSHVARLGLADVAFIHGDAREMDLELGSIYYLYVPFVGESLRRVLDRLRLVANDRHITLCALGFDLGKIEWLRVVDDESLLMTIYESTCVAGASRTPLDEVLPSLVWVATERSFPGADR